MYSMATPLLQWGTAASFAYVTLQHFIISGYQVIHTALVCCAPVYIAVALCDTG